MTEVNVDKAVAAAVKTGKVSFGANSAVQNAQAGRAKLIVLSSNCPENVRQDIEYYCNLSEVPVITFRGSSLDLGGICGKPFAVSALSIREAGDSEILKLVERAPEESEEFVGGNE